MGNWEKKKIKTEGVKFCQVSELARKVHTSVSGSSGFCSVVIYWYLFPGVADWVGISTLAMKKTARSRKKLPQADIILL